MKERISITLDAKLMGSLNSIIDGVTIANRSQAIEYLIRKTLDDQKTAVILCGGKHIALENGFYKVCAPFNGATVIEHNIKTHRKNGFEKFFIAGSKKALIEVFKIIGNGESYGISVEYVEDDPKPKGSMNTLSKVRQINQTFLVLSGDEILGDANIASVWKAHVLNKSLATLHVQATTSKMEKMGTVILEGNLIKEFVEKAPTKNSLIHYSGFFVADQEFFNQKGDSLEEDVFPILSEKGLLGGFVSSSSEIHIHTKKDLLKVK